MHIYLVGGAVRDKLLNRPVVDHDHVVVGARPEEMLALGYKPVGKDFPVFLHPQTGEEYALARTERKSGRGYRGFVVQADATVSSTAKQRRMFAEAEQRMQEYDRVLCAGTAFVLTSTVMRGVVTAIYWMAPPVYPYAFFPSRDAATVWARMKRDESARR